VRLSTYSQNPQRKKKEPKKKERTTTTGTSYFHLGMVLTNPTTSLHGQAVMDYEGNPRSVDVTDIRQDEDLFR